MRNVEYTTKQGPECHPIYEVEEAREVGIEFLDSYRDIRRQGEWIRTDDEKVVQVLKMGQWPSGKRWIRTCTGTFAIDCASPHVDTEPRQSRHSISGTWRNLETIPLTERIKEFARLYAHGVDRISAYRQVFPEARSERYIDQRTRALVKREDFRKIVAQELEDILAELGIDNKYILRGLQELYENAENDATRFSAIRELGKIVGTIDSNKGPKSVQQTFLGIPQQELARLQAPQPIRAIESSEEADFGESVSIDDAEIVG